MHNGERDRRSKRKKPFQICVKREVAMDKTIASKNVSGVGYVEIRETDNLKYVLVVNGQIRQSSSNLSYIKSEYDRIW
jgi:hypothetical protein